MSERRHEPRVGASVPVRIWGIDIGGERFSQNALAIDISQSGALLTAVESTPRCGDLIGIAYASKEARFRVVWVCKPDGERKVKVAAQKLAGDECPWAKLLVRPAKAEKQASVSLNIGA